MMDVALIDRARTTDCPLALADLGVRAPLFADMYYVKNNFLNSCAPNKTLN